MKLYGLILALISSLAWSADEVGSYTKGCEQVGEDGWVLLCYSGDWDATHDESWMRRQSSISSSCGNARLLYVPIYQNPTPEQAAQVASQLEGAPVDLHNLPSVPCAILLDADGNPYKIISGDDFKNRAAGMIRQSQAQLRTRCNLLRQAENEEGAVKAQTLSGIWRLSIAPPPGLQQQMQAADPEDTAGIAEWSHFNPQALASRIRTMTWLEALAELERVQQASLSQEERQAVLAIRIGCVHHHLGAAGADEIRSLASTCANLVIDTPLSKAAKRAATLWGRKLDLEQGWNAELLPAIPAECEVANPHKYARAGEYRITFSPRDGQDALRVTRVSLYDGKEKISEDAHSCNMAVGDMPVNNEYILFVREAPTRPRLVIAFDQQGKKDTCGTITVRYIKPDGAEEKLDDPFGGS